MDAVRMLEFPNAHFDLVNQRLGWSYLRSWEWPKILQEFKRVARHKGIIRITEGGWMTGNSEALTKLHRLALQASFASGHLFVENDNNSVIERLPQLFEQHGIQSVQTLRHELAFPGGNEIGDAFYEDISYLFHVSIPFFRKNATIPNNYETIYQQMLVDARQPGFVGAWTLQTTWGSILRRTHPGHITE